MQLKQFYAMTKADEILSISIDNLFDSENFQIAILTLMKILYTKSSMVTEDDKNLKRILSNLQKLNVNKKQQ